MGERHAPQGLPEPVNLWESLGARRYAAKRGEALTKRCGRATSRDEALTKRCGHACFWSLDAAFVKASTDLRGSARDALWRPLPSMQEERPDP